jgi:hypothetical protein
LLACGALDSLAKYVQRALERGRIADVAVDA